MTRRDILTKTLGLLGAGLVLPSQAEEEITFDIIKSYFASNPRPSLGVYVGLSKAGFEELMKEGAHTLGSMSTLFEDENYSWVLDTWHGNQTRYETRDDVVRAVQNLARNGPTFGGNCPIPYFLEEGGRAAVNPKWLSAGWMVVPIWKTPKNFVSYTRTCPSPDGWDVKWEPIKLEGSTHWRNDA